MGQGGGWVGAIGTVLTWFGLATQQYWLAGVGIAMTIGGTAAAMMSAGSGADLEMPNFGNNTGSVRYGFGELRTTTSSELPIPVIYGSVKVAGNNLYQSPAGTNVTRAVALCEGEIDSVSDIRFNDIPIAECEGCSQTTYTGTSTQTIDSRFTGILYGLRYLAYLALTLEASDKLKGSVNVTCVVRGQKVKTWDGSEWSVAKTYSNNPAACILDFITDTRYGCGIDSARLDLDSFGEVYDYCNIQVDDGSGNNTLENRYELDYVIDSKRPQIDILNDMCMSFGGFLVNSQGKLKLRVEKEEVAVQDFDMDSIKNNSFSYAITSKDDIYNKVKLMYIDPDEAYTKVFAIAEDLSNQERRIDEEGGDGICEKEVEVFPIIRFSQASRMATLFLKVAQQCGIICSFKASIKAVHCEPGDIIEISHDVPQWSRKLFRLLSIKEMPDDERELMCREYRPEVYDDGYGSGLAVYSQRDTGYEDPLKAPDNPSGITVSEIGELAGDGTYITTLNISWTAPAKNFYIQHYWVEYSKDGGSYYLVGTATGTNIQLKNVIDLSTYIIRVKSVNTNGLYSTGATSSPYTVIGKSTPPANVSGFSVSLSGDSFLFTWDAVTDLDLRGYEIREGSSWETGTLIDTDISNTSLLKKPATMGVHIFRIKAKDTTGNYSLVEDIDTITVTVAPDTNITVDTYLWANLTEPNNDNGGTFSGEASFEPINKYDASYNRRVFCVRTNNTWGEIQAQGKTCGTLQLEGLIIGEPLSLSPAIYTSEIIDVGSVLSGLTTFNLSIDNSTKGTILKEIRTSADNITWDDWVTWSDTTYYYGRYFQVRITITLDNNTTNVYVYDGVFSIDVPDLTATDGGNGVEIEVGGTTIYYSRTFTVKPRTLVVSTVDKSSSVVGIITEQMPDSFKCTLYDKDNNSVAGAINYYAKGY